MLKQLKLSTELKQKRNELSVYQARQAELEKRQTDLATALEEAETDEDIELVSEQVQELEKEVGDENLDEKINEIEGKIRELENELSEIEKPAEKVEERKEVIGMEKRTVVRDEYFERSEVKEFYEKFKNLRAVGGEGLTIPQIIVNRIMDIVGDYSTLYPLVNKIKVGGTARILIDTDTTAATWVEQGGTLASGNVGTIVNVDFDGYKIGKVTFVDNHILKDSIINIDEYVTKKLARAIALGLDLAILSGKGSSSYQPVGILTELPSTNIKEANASKMSDVVKHIGVIDTGADNVGEIVAVMKRSTYYNRFLQYSVQVNSAGNVVGKLPNLTNPDLLGIRVVFNNNVADDVVVFGDYEKYTLVEREDIKVAKSEHIKFTEDQMAFRGLGRFDGKPTNRKAFVAVNIDEGALQSLTVTSSASETTSGDTVIKVAQPIMVGRKYYYKTQAGAITAPTYDSTLSGWTLWDGKAEITATTTHNFGLAEVSANGKVKKYGATTVTSKA